jgi:predicted transcriptional regulator
MDIKVQEYIKYYNEIDHMLSDVLWNDNYQDGYVWYKQKLFKIKDGNFPQSSIIKKHFDAFKHFGYIRNEIIHNYPEKISITNEWIEEIVKYKNILENPPKCWALFNKAVFICDINDKLSDIIKIMKEKIYTHVPVYNWDQFVDLMTESTIVYGLAKYIASNWDLILENVSVKDILEENKNDTYEFVSQNLSIYNIKDKFENSISEGKRLWALLITNLWKKEEQLLWIITARDLPTIEDKIR